MIANSYSVPLIAYISLTAYNNNFVNYLFVLFGYCMLYMLQNIAKITLSVTWYKNTTLYVNKVIVITRLQFLQVRNMNVIFSS